MFDKIGLQSLHVCWWITSWRRFYATSGSQPLLDLVLVKCEFQSNGSVNLCTLFLSHALVYRLKISALSTCRRSRNWYTYQLWCLVRLPSFYFHGSGFSKSQSLRLMLQFGIMQLASLMYSLAKLTKVSFRSVLQEQSANCYFCATQTCQKITCCA